MSDRRESWMKTAMREGVTDGEMDENRQDEDGVTLRDALC